MPAGDAFWLCHECRAEMRPIERNGILTCASCGGEFIEILDEDINPDPFSELPHPPTRPGQASRASSPSAAGNPSFYQRMFGSLLDAQPGQQAPRGRGQSAIPDLGSPAAMHGQQPPGASSAGRSFEFSTPGGGQGRIVFGSFGGGGGGGGGFMLGGGGGGGGGQGGHPFVPGFQIPPNPYRQNPPPGPHMHDDPIPMPPDQLLQGLLDMLADENGMAPHLFFSGLPGLGGPRGASNLGDYVTSQQGFEDILERLMHAAGPQGPIPAADAVIDNLPRATFDEKGLGASVYKDCPVCKDDFAVGDEYIRIPCAHIFHPDCLTPWLKQNGSCPVCRYSLVPEGGSAAGGGSASAPAPSSTAPSGQPSSQPAPDRNQPQGQAPQTSTDQPESFFTSILNRLWGQGGEARSPTTETGPSGQNAFPDDPHLPGSMPSGPSRSSGPSSSNAAQSASGTRAANLATDIPLPASPAPPNAAESQEHQSLYAGFQARTRSFNSTPTPSVSGSASHEDPPDPVLQNVSSAIPDDYRARHRQRERDQERRDLPHDDLD